MSTIKERVEREQSNIDKIYLYREGIFYRAYERSAYGRDIVYLGFPEKVADRKSVV